MMSESPYWEFRCGGQKIPWKKIEEFRNIEKFPEHKAAANKLGFDLMVKRAKIGMAKHVRVRPLFPAGWELHGALVVWDEQITKDALRQILEFSGRYKGLGDWRPGGRTPGPYGIFEAEIS
jgi:hypothetical protein